MEVLYCVTAHFTSLSSYICKTWIPRSWSQTFWPLLNIYSDISGLQFSPAAKSRFWHEPSKFVYSFVLGLVWKLRLSRIRICRVPTWHPWAFCVIQDGVQNGRRITKSPLSHLLIEIETHFLGLNLCFWGQGIHCCWYFPWETQIYNFTVVVPIIWLGIIIAVEI